MATTPPPRRAAGLRTAAASLRRWLTARPIGRAAHGAARGTTPRVAGYPGDYTGALSPVYAPSPDGRPDPGEIVWTWVPYEEDHARGKDRPVLLVGHDGGWLLGLPLTSKDHDGHPEQEERRRWVDIGTGAWDRQGRPSEVRVDRVVRVHPDHVRREGAVLSPGRFRAVAQAVSELHR